MTTLAVVSAGLRSPSSTRLLADRMAEAVAAALPSPVEVTTIEVRDYAHAIADALLSGFPCPEVEKAISTVTSADAVIVVTPTFQGSYSGLFKSFMDLFEAGTLRHKPIALAATGGTERHSLVIEYALRPLFSYLGATTAPTGIYAATSDFGAEIDQLSGRLRRVADEIAALNSLGCETGVPTSDDETEDALTEAQRAMSEAGGGSFTDFGDLLKALGQD